MAWPGGPPRMDLTQSFLLILLLIAASAFFSLAEITLAASRRLRLRQMADEGEPRAERVMRLQEQPGHYFTVVQIGVNAVAILGGVVGEGALSPHFTLLFSPWVSPTRAATLGFAASFITITAVFIVFADLFPKRLGMANPEQLAVRLLPPMLVLMVALKPVVWLFSRSTDLLFKLMGLPAQRDDRITSADILAMTEAGTQAGVLAVHEQQAIANIFELDTQTVSSAMSQRERTKRNAATSNGRAIPSPNAPSDVDTACARNVLPKYAVTTFAQSTSAHEAAFQTHEIRANLGDH